MNAQRAMAAAGVAVIRRRQHEIDAELLQMADPRLADFIFEVDEIKGSLCMMLRFWPTTSSHRAFTNEPRYASNEAEVVSARSALVAAVAECKRLQRAAISYVDVGQALIAMNEALAKPLAALEMNPPSLLSYSADVGPPMTWGGYSCWTVEEIGARQLRKSQLDARDAEEAWRTAVNTAALHR